MSRDHEFVVNLLRGGGQPQLIDSNPVAIGLRAMLVAVDPERGSAELRFEPGVEHLQGAGSVQGGIIATMLDFALSFAVSARLSEELSHTTASLNVHYLRAVAAGPVTVLAEVDRVGKRLGFASARLLSATGELLATGTAVLAILSAKP